MQVWTGKSVSRIQASQTRNTADTIQNVTKTGKRNAVKVARSVWKQGKLREGSTYAYLTPSLSEA